MTKEIDAIIKGLLLKDLRIQCRQRNISPAGGREALGDRLKEHMLETGDIALRNEDGSVQNAAAQIHGMANPGNNYSRPDGQNVGNFLGDRPSSRVLAAPGGNSSFSLSHGVHEPSPGPMAPPPASIPEEPAPPAVAAAPSTSASQPKSKASFLNAMTAKIAGQSGGSMVQRPPANFNGGSPTPLQVVTTDNVQSTPSDSEKQPLGRGQDNNYSRPSGQNVGNFLTDKPSSRVLAPPGGGSTLRLG